MNSPPQYQSQPVRRSFLRYAAVVTGLAIQMLAVSADDDDDDREERKTIPLSTLPAPVASTLTEIASGIRITEAESKGRWKRFYEFEGTLSGAELEIKIAANGTLLDVEYESRRKPQTVPVTTLPSAVVTAITSAYPEIRIREVELTKLDDIDLYEVLGVYRSRRISFYVSGTGAFVGQGHDSDGDGLPDSREREYGCDPTDSDSDDDMFPDGFETANGTDPMDPEATPEILKIDLLHGEQSSQDVIALSVTTFQGGLFSIEHCPNARDWTSLDISIVGDGQSHEVIVPVEDSSDCGYFRITISDLSTVKDIPIGGGVGTTPFELSPNHLDGTKFDVDLGDDGRKELMFDSGGRGQLVKRVGRRIEIEPFRYRYVRTGKSTATVTVRFPRSGVDLVVEYELEFTADGKGTVVRSDSHGTASGDFSYRNRPGRNNKV